MGEANKVLSDQDSLWCLHEYVEHQARLTPDHIAIVYLDQQLTYEELNQRANQLAKHILKKGLATEELVAVYMERSCEWVISLLAILKAGGCYLPIDPTYPMERIQYILEDSQTRVVLTQSRLADDIPWEGQVIVYEENVLQAEAKDDLKQPCSPDQLAYVIYTSGTTGRPKGTMLSHTGIVNLRAVFTTSLQITNEDRIVQFASISFDASIWEVFMALLTGASIYISPKQVIENINHFETFLHRHHITVATLPPTYAIHLCPEYVYTLKTLVTAGSAASTQIVEKWKSHVNYVNAYGPTETSICATLWFSSEYKERTKNVPIGRPLDHYEVLILSENNHPLGEGEEGELCISGSGLARGYLNQPKLTNEKFIEHPVSPGEKIYKTGDLAKWLPDGNIEFLGRMDHQVKIRGYRIELEEIESVLLDYSDVHEVVVTSTENHRDQQTLCAYMTGTSDLDSDQVKKYALDKLPSYMAPAYYMILDKMPLTPNGKIDRQALPDVQDWLKEKNACPSPPKDRLEEILIKVWEDVLSHSPIGVDDDFYELGGDSINAIQITAKMHALGLRLETRYLLEYPTIRSVKPFIDKGWKTSTEPIEGKVLLTPIQRWFFDQQFTDRDHWNQSVWLYNKEGYSVEILAEALEELLKHHDGLRTYFVFDQEIEQYVQATDKTELQLLMFDLSDTLEAENIIYEETKKIQSSLQLTRPPLFKGAVFRTSQGDHLLLIAHHLIIDAVSYTILVKDLELLYDQRLNNKATQLPVKTTPYQEWARRIHDFTCSNEINNQVTYWKSVLGEETVSLLKDNPHDNVPQKDKSTVKISFEAQETTNLLKDANRAYQTDIQDLLLLSVGLALKEWMGAHSYLINVEGHGREYLFEQVDLSRSIGWFTSQYPVLLDMKSPGDMSHFIKKIKEMTRNVPNRGCLFMPLLYLTDGLQTITPDGYGYRPEINFNYLGQLDNVYTPRFGCSDLGGGEALGPDGFYNLSPNGEIYFPLSITMWVSRGKLHGSFSFSPGQLIEEATVYEFAHFFKSSLSQLLDHCLKKLSTQNNVDASLFKDIEMEEVSRVYEVLEDVLD
ncbi:amino acid adenylation domain-containing protein [Bacillus sp. B19-2]|uniref:amino acid adenylation domain-containing protein n=1 Tax=Bacillus sp. B19-2 TaxID=2929516 RepID=UPI001FBB7BAB|nr:amino acid adenylation domain-containing protein [Bacillus sp. B19-2]MCJ2147808.1 amino acid adenylation domain-containing protein [Bacillus sp. B19-2]